MENSHHTPLEGPRSIAKTERHPSVSKCSIRTGEGGFLLVLRINRYDVNKAHPRTIGDKYATTLSLIPNIVDNYLGSKLKEAVDVVGQLKSDRIREEAQAENKDVFNKVDENIMKIIKEQVNAQVKKKIDKILPRIEKLVNEQPGSEVLIRSSNEAKTSHANLYKALVDAYEADKAILDAYGDTVTIKRRQDNADDDQEPFARPDWGSKRIRAGKEPESSSAPREKTSTTTGKSTKGYKSHQQSVGQSALAEVPMHTADDFKDPTH
ncbi:hypothetical protein Tco_0897442 [Tanacetum coccineum]